MNWYKYATIIAAITSLITGSFVYYNNRKNRINLFFILLSLCVSSWCFSSFTVSTSTNPQLALYYGRLLQIPVIFMPPIWVALVFSMIGKRIKDSKFVKNMFIISLILTPLFFIATFSNLFFFFFFKKFSFAHYFLDPGPIYAVFIAYWLIYAYYGFIKMLFTYRKASIQQKNKLKYFFTATFVGSIAALIYFALIYGIKVIPVADSIIILYLSIMAYAIIQHRFMDIRLVVTRASIFAFVYTAVLAIPFIVGGIIKTHIPNTSSHWWVIPVLIGIILASAGPFIYMRLQRKLESRLRAREFKSHEALSRLSHNMLRFTNLEVLLRRMVHYLVKVLKLKFAGIYLLNSQSGIYVLSSAWYCGESIELPHEFNPGSYLTKHLSLKKLPVVTEELSLYDVTLSKSLATILSELKISAVIPSFLKSGLIGFLVLSDRRDKTPFTQEDINLLMVLSNEAALAIDNAQLHQKEVSRIVEKSKREALADMAPGASHQFNNRLASISSSVELLLFKMENFNIEAQKDENTKILLREAKKALELIDSEVYKGKEITSAILKRAKAKVEFQKFNLVSLIENTYKLVMISRSHSGLDKARELKFNIVSSNETLNIFASEALLQDVFYNLIDNAYDAIQDKAHIASQTNSLFQGEIEVTLAQQDHVIVAQVRDNGIGLTKENQRKLFTPYFTTKATSNKGSGLGLCVIRDFIEMHRGTIVCDSEYEKGATFTIKLPINKEKYHGN
ncbi:MAG: ATP-binding protein [Candidatus Omnitrophica bacterium]|nr:ATP-binding protein [Candidatus Omnitrophota bacterium]